MSPVFVAMPGTQRPWPGFRRIWRAESALPLFEGVLHDPSHRARPSRFAAAPCSTVPHTVEHGLDW